MTRVLVTGGRDFDGYSALARELDRLLFLDPGPPLTVVHGDARGADALADEWARLRAEYDVYLETHPADFAAEGRAAGPRRNERMVRSGIDVAVACPGGRGTADCVDRLRAAGVPITFVGDDDEG